MTRETTFKQIPQVPCSDNPALNDFLVAVKQRLDIYQGNLGDGNDVVSRRGFSDLFGSAAFRNVVDTMDGSGNTLPTEAAIKTYGDVHWVSTSSDSAGPGSWGSPEKVIITSGVINVSGGKYYSVDTEGGIGSDNLLKIIGLNDGDEIILKAHNDARTVILIDGTNLKLNRSRNFTLNNIYDRMRLQCVGSDVCVELGGRSSGGN